LLARIDELSLRLEALERENAALREKLGQPPKTPNHSSLPPSQGHKASDAAASKPKSKPHKGSHRVLHPDPTRTFDVLAERCPHCTGDVSVVIQMACERYAQLPQFQFKHVRLSMAYRPFEDLGTTVLSVVS